MTDNILLRNDRNLQRLRTCAKENKVPRGQTVLIQKKSMFSDVRILQSRVETLGDHGLEMTIPEVYTNWCREG